MCCGLYNRWLILPWIYSSLPVSQSTPVYPKTHIQIYSLTPSVQFPPFWQESGMQSLTSGMKMTERVVIKFMQFNRLYSDIVNDKYKASFCCTNYYFLYICHGFRYSNLKCTQSVLEAVVLKIPNLYCSSYLVIL